MRNNRITKQAAAKLYAEIKNNIVLYQNRHLPGVDFDAIFGDKKSMCIQDVVRAIINAFSPI